MPPEQDEGGGPGGQGLPGPLPGPLPGRPLLRLRPLREDTNEDDDDEDNSEDEYELAEEDRDDDEDGDDTGPAETDIPLGLTIFSDREKGIAKALKIHFPDCSRVFCMKHIERNIAVKFRLTKPVKEPMWKACRA